jgi:hypothetical protein
MFVDICVKVLKLTDATCFGMMGETIFAAAFSVFA